MEIRRKVTRLCLILPAAGADGARAPRASAAADAVAELIQAAVAQHGVQAARRVAGSAPDATARYDVALWLCGPDGDAQACDPREVSARVHAGLVATGAPTLKHLGRYDALVVPHDALLDPVKRAAARAPGRTPPTVTAPLCGEPTQPRDAEKSLRRVAGVPTVVLDVRDDFEAVIDRVVFQLALKVPAAAIVLVAPKDERARGEPHVDLVPLSTARR